MTDRAQLERRVAELAAGQGYRLVPDATGFDLHRDPLDSRWRGVFVVGESTRTVLHHVTVDDTRAVVTITDDLRTVAWRAGTSGQVPYLVGGASRAQGRILGGGVQKTYAWRNGHLEQESSVSYDVDEGRELVRTAARELGYTERAGAAQRVGLVFAVVGGIGALVALLGVAYVFLLR